jgi:glutamate formiminotransferase/formiminotetrahydrofolate cyclodeaminase
MTTKIVECIPNFSEGRREDVITQIVDAIRGVTGATLLDHSADPDHNRTVVTFVGEPEVVEEAAFQAIAKAAELIDLNQHSGEHPRMGATDVVPFVPISGVTMTECVEMARRVGKRVGDILDVPVFLYEKAATDPAKENLARIRSGEYEAIKDEIGSSVVRTPDFGPHKLGPAGATVIGARDPLIAYNVYLNTDNVEIAEKISRAVRHLSGGLRFVKGMGFLVEGQAQVSMNLTNFRKTPVARVVEMIRREAARYGVSITHSELVGLIPQAALLDAATWYLQLDDFDPMQVLENRMTAAQAEADAPTADGETFLEALADGNPTPGGGSAAAYGAAMGAGLVAMVARTTVGKKAYAAVEPQMWALIEQADALRMELTAAVSQDAAAFERVMAAFKLPKGSEAEQAARTAAIETATLQAAAVPLRVAEMAVRVITLALEAAQTGNRNAITDAASGAALARAGLRAAGLNVRINVSSMADAKAGKGMLKQLNDLEKQAAKLEGELDAVLVERGGLAF